MITRRALMRPLLGLALGLACALSLSAQAAEEFQEITDGVGRRLRVIRAPRRIYATSPVGAMMLYSLSPEKMVGWNYKLGPAERRFLLPQVRDLPVLGGWFGENGKGNRETLLASRPDIVISIGGTDRTAVDFADRLQEQLGIPVYVDSGHLADTAAAYERLGVLLSKPAEAATLAGYARRVLAETRARAEALPPGERPSVYYAEGQSLSSCAPKLE